MDYCTELIKTQYPIKPKGPNDPTVSSKVTVGPAPDGYQLLARFISLLLKWTENVKGGRASVITCCNMQHQETPCAEGVVKSVEHIKVESVPNILVYENI